MELTNTFTVPVPVEHAWEALLDIEDVAECVPGASLDSIDADGVTGTVRVRLGPVQLTYGGRARFTELDRANWRAVLEATGKETRGSGTASATVTTTLTPDGEHTVIEVITDLAITGRPAQFGRGVMQDVSNRLIGQFARALSDRLAARYTGQAPLPDAATPGSGAPTAPATPAPNRSATAVDTSSQDNGSLNLMAVVGIPLAKRLALPVLVVAAIVVGIVLLR
ncbi:SRPBCC family protein [Phytoactinopolyspora limicola]|uniref:SRPBCC family protein n=1 Tax=Phytoactinopolyspora limicola TaxID=2715536 RepID=UPI00140CF563|nr:SRPBCC family protein [Phytoactinopolyspora limicola]